MTTTSSTQSNNTISEDAKDPLIMALIKQIKILQNELRLTKGELETKEKELDEICEELDSKEQVLVEMNEDLGHLENEVDYLKRTCRENDIEYE